MGRRAGEQAGGMTERCMEHAGGQAGRREGRQHGSSRRHWQQQPGLVIIIKGLSLLQSIPPTMANKQMQAQKKGGAGLESC